MIHDDTWSAVFKPSPYESSAEKKARIAQQQEAARISKEIDDAIERSKKQFDKRKKAIKVLLLGQAESGKSTMLRNFQLAFCPDYFRRETPIWKIIIQLNLIGSVKRLLAIIEDELECAHSSASSLPSNLRRSPTLPTAPSRQPSTGSALSRPRASSRTSSARQRSPASPHVIAPSKHTSLDLKSAPSDPALTPAHAALRLRLLPLLSVETNLARQLLPEFGGESPPLSSSSGWTKWASGTGGHSTHPVLPGKGEICVRAGGAWKSVLERVTGTINNDSDTHQGDACDDSLANHIEPRTPSSVKFSIRNTRPHPSDPTPLLEALAPDIHSLWTDPAVQAVLKRRGVQLEHSAGFFLNDVLRIGKSGWKPDIDDIVRARLRTFGVEEHRFAVPNSSDWYIYDVGGSRGSRHHWVSYFDDVQAIIFLAPLMFNQILDEDKMINRLEDSIGLWKEVCANTLLARANIILFLNKMDILESTLNAGVHVQTYVPTYSHPNDMNHVVKYFREKFHAYHRRLSPKQRPFFCHGTSAIDTKATQVVLSGVREGILRGHLEKLSVI